MASSPRTPLHRQLDRLQHRLFLLGFGRGFILCVSGALFLGALGLLVWSLGHLRASAYDLDHPALLARLGAAGVGLLLATIAALGIAWWQRPSRLSVALQLDAEFGLRERVTTALTLPPDTVLAPMGQALLADATAQVEKLDVTERHPLRLSRLGALIPGALVCFLLAAFYCEPAAATGSGPEVEGVRPLANADEVAQKLKELERKPKVPGEKPREGQDELDKLDAEYDKAANQRPKTEDEARELLKDLTSLEERLKKHEKSLAERTQALRERFEQQERMDRLAKRKKEEPKDGPAKEFEQARESLERGDTKEAQDRLEKLSRELKDDKLTPEQRQQLSREMQDLQDKLDRLSREAADAKELEKMAQRGELDPDQLQRELDQLRENQGKLSAEDLKNLAEAAEKLKDALKNLKEGKDGDAAQLLEEMGKELGELDKDGEMKAMALKLAKLQAAQKMIGRSLDGGQPIPGAGNRPQGDPVGDVKPKEERANGTLTPGAATNVRHVPGQGIKGKPKPEELQGVLREAGREASEAIERQRLPRSASDMAKGYFEKLRGPEPEKKQP
jgi:hypothetical protein